MQLVRCLFAPRRGAAPMLLFATMLLMTACNEVMTELYGGQTEAEANEMVLALRSQGIKAVKISKKDGVSIAAPDSAFADSIRVLTSAGLPRLKRPSVMDLFPPGKMFTTPAEESIRSRFALEQQIAADLQLIQGIRGAQVILAFTEPVGRGPAPPSTASVMLIYDDMVESDGLVSRVKLFIQNSVPQLGMDRISVVLFHSHYELPKLDPLLAVK